jgi:PAS domain S-box-containing protein
VRGKPAADFLPPEPSALRRAKALQVLESGRPVHFEDYVFQRVLETDIFPIFTDEDTVSQLAVFWRDVTREKEATRALRDAEEKYRLLVENASEGILVISEGRIVFNNSRAAELLKYPSDGLHNLLLSELLHPEDLERLSLASRSRENRAVFDEAVALRFRDQLDSERLMRTRTVSVSWEGKDAHLVYLMDVSDEEVAGRRIADSDADSP